jgi:beta-ureidopropionase / N-carbamoyl-L-amino-acid hydrolase
MTGSHLDTQPTGGKLDGAYDVLAGLEVVRTLNDLGYETEAPVEIVCVDQRERLALLAGDGRLGGVRRRL